MAEQPNAEEDWQMRVDVRINVGRLERDLGIRKRSFVLWFIILL